jgi:hypothetical protein
MTRAALILAGCLAVAALVALSPRLTPAELEAARTSPTWMSHDEFWRLHRPHRQ